ncbi:M10 family metallopeptidase C-terminal domain-containing protein [Xanthobacter agilis]|uniref:M10 family metallopeptidase C-terminal domain-containing protein n=2 Tax=Xanthobacter agilis TaxID=47492 RepID=UPI003726D168
MMSVDAIHAALATTAAASTADLPTYSASQIANYLRYGEGEALVIANSDSAISVNLTGLSAARATLARLALATWSDICGISFTETTGSATITFDDSDDGAYTSYSTSGSTITSADINVAADWYYSDSSVDSYTFQTFIHEIGHALGLGHPGPYNGDADYSTDALYANDSWQMTVMSYFSQEEAGQGSYRFVMTPMMADILAVRTMYGYSTTHAGNTTYGFNSTVSGTTSALYDFDNYDEAPSFTIVDDAGTDTLDASGYSDSQLIDLRSGTLSDIGGLTGNIGIYLTTVVENGIGGSGADKIIGNSAANVLNGRNGNDRLSGASGNDRLIGGAGRDILNGGVGNDVMAGGAGNDTYYVDATGDVVQEATGGGTDTVRTALSRYTLGAATEVLVYTGTSAFVGNGNGLANTITGGSGNDRLSGGSGNDRISGGAGRDTLNGGTGVDVLTGGSGRDIFVYSSIAQSRSSAYDRLTDFSTASGDRLNLSAIDADTTTSGVNDAFVYVGTSAFSGTAGELRYAQGKILGDVNGDGAADLMISVGTSFAYSSSSVIV